MPNGWKLTPVGSKIRLGDLPLNLAVSPDSKYAAVTNNGQSVQSVMLIDVQKQALSDSVGIPASFLGLAFNSDGSKLYASGGNENIIRIYNVIGGKLSLADSIVLGKPWPNKISPTGLCVDDLNKRVFVVTKEDSMLYIIDTPTKKITESFKLPAEAYTCTYNNDRHQLFISVWGAGEVLVYSTMGDSFLDTIKVGSNPNDMALTKDGKYLFVSNSNDNSVSVISTADDKVIETLNAALYPNSPEGSTTNSVGLSKDDKTLYIANADNNCLAVFDVSHPGNSKSKGFVPTGWYPTCVRVIDGKIWVTNGKGFCSLANPHGPNPTKPREKASYKKGDNQPKVQYIGGGLLMGGMSIIPEPNAKLLAQYTRAVYNNTPYKADSSIQAGIPKNNPLLKTGDKSEMPYVFYVMKENRTYDQVLGDEANGNGDTSLCLFPKKITPNEHALSEQFVLLDNFYVDAEVSADGHNWSMAAYANDYTEKTWPTSYGGRGGTYDYGGSRKIALPLDGFIWDNCTKHNVSWRNYGEFEDEGKPYLKELQANSCKAYPGWNLAIHDAYREQVWEKDFDSLVAINAVPKFSVIYLPDDHTSGLAKGAFSPYAAVADNDQALGKLVDHLSKSPIWKHCVVFVMEDDAQNGPDHVDAHRSIAFMAGPYVKRHFTDHSMYSTCSMIKTMELLLGLPTMSQYDAAAKPMWRCFTDTADFFSYSYIPAGVDIEQRNTAYNDLMKKSDKFDLRQEDKVPENLFNEVLWIAIKGNKPMPPARHCAFVMPIDKSLTGDDDDDDGDGY